MKTGFQIHLGLTWILLVGMLSSCQPKSTLPPTLPEVPVSLLVSLDAPAQIKRDGWNDYVPVGFGALVYPTDLFKTTGTVTLLCADMQTVKTLAGRGRAPCPLPQNDQTLKYDEMWFSSGIRGVITTTIPYIIYPRSTTIVEPRPLLRWHNTGAISYKIEIRQGGLTFWFQTDVNGDALVYPEDAPAFVAGKDYVLIVTDNTTGHSSAEDPNPGLGFQVVSIDQRAEIEKQQQAILSLSGLEPAAQKLALALFYYNQEIGGHGLWGAARSLLDEVAQARPSAPAVNLRLGEVLGKMKLWSEAQTAYATALAQAQTLNDLESQAEALAALWLITGNQANFDKAINIYEQIGATDKMERLKDALKP